MATKSGSNRIGWNQRGPTDRELLQQAHERSDPESYYWQNQTRNYKLRLCEVMGAAAFEEWADRLLPDDVLEQTTWKQIAELYQHKLHIEEGVPTQAEIDRHDWMNDPKHYKIQGEDYV